MPRLESDSVGSCDRTLYANRMYTWQSVEIATANAETIWTCVQVLRSVHAMIRWVATLLAIAPSCGFPRPADVLPADGGEDGAVPSQVTVHVSASGNDANDGIALPVLTLKRALGVAMAQTKVVTIAMEAGRYGVTTGETFPYVLPSNVTIAGSTTGSTVLVGNTTTPGITVDSGTLQDLEFESFTTAVTARQMTQLTHLHVRASDISVRAETMATVVVNGLDIIGTAGACSVGVELNGATTLTATGIATHSLGTSIQIKDSTTTKLTSASFTGDASCPASVLQVSSSASFILSDSTLDGGTNGITFGNALAATQATLTNVTIQNMKSDGLAGDTATVHMTGGELSSNMANGADAMGGNWVFTNVTMASNNASGFYLQNAALTMRGCTMSNNGNGVHVASGNKIDLGTQLDNGNNTIQNRVLGVIVDGGTQVSAVGNTWQPSVQGTNNLGKYGAATVITGPVPVVQGNNYAILDQSTLIR